MIKAEHTQWADFIFSYYEKLILKRSFAKFNIVNDLPLIPSDRSLIITPNHISWWDGFFIRFALKGKIDRNMYLMMLESQLRRYWFFKKIGAFSINPQNPISTAKTFIYTEQILKDSDNFAVVYPQGQIEPFERRPLTLRSGINKIIKRICSNTIILPVGFKIQYFEEKNPEVYCRFGDIIEGEKSVKDFSLFIDLFTENLDLLTDASSKREHNTRLF